MYDQASNVGPLRFAELNAALEANVNQETVTGTIESINDNQYGLVLIKLVGDDTRYLMPGPITVTLHRQQDHYMAVMRLEAVAHPDSPEACKP